MPFLVLLAIALTAGFGAAAVARRTRPTPAVAPAAVAGLVLGLAALTALVVATDGDIGLDTAVARWADRHASGWSTDALQVVTRLGAGTTVLVAAVLLAIADRVVTARRSTAWYLLLVVFGEDVLSTVLKDSVDRARPGLNPIAATLNPSFPSGHSSSAAAFWAAAAIVALAWVPPGRRPLLAGGAVAVAVAVAVSRVMLDVHWVTDVLAGLALGWAWALACAATAGARLLRTRSPT